MHDEHYRRIERDSRFQTLVRTRGRLAWTLSAIMLALYYGFISVIAFVPEWLGQPLWDGATTTWGILVGVGLILAAIGLTGIYVRKVNSEFDALNAELLAGNVETAAAVAEEEREARA